MKEIYFKEDAREKLFSGIQKLCDAVSATMGPNGKTVIIPSKKDYDKYIITKDGVSVAEQIVLKDPIENIGAQLVKEVAQKTADEAGDGTTTATVLANAFIQNLKDFDSNDINKAFDEIIPKVLEQLKLNSRELKREDIKYVASISANNDIQIGNIIQQAFDHSDIVKAEESENNEDTLELIDGMKLNVTYFSKHFITNEKKAECELDKPLVLLLDGKLENLQIFERPIKYAAENNRSLLIITEHVSSNTLRLLESNVLNGSLKLSVIKTPGFGQHRKDLIKDLSIFTGAKVINNFNTNFTESVLGVLKSSKTDKYSTILIKDDNIDISNYLNEISELKQSKDLLDIQRYENLTGKISIIKVGGGSELEVKERYDRYDDAIKATQCALEEGIVEGGGNALVEAIFSIRQSLNDNIDQKIYDSLVSPFNRIKDNGTVFDNTKTMFEQNIIDPLKVTRTALENAASIAKTVLSTEVVVLNQREWN